jgi:MFS family permease
VTQARWYFGWNIVAASAVLTLLSVGLRLGIGPFFLPISSDLGFSRSLLASIIAVGMLCYGLGMPVAGHIINRWGTRAVVLIGAALVDIAVGWSIVARSPASFMLSFGVLLSLGLAFMSQVSFAPIISHWFIRQRGKALLYLATGSMAGMALLTPILQAAIEAFGWRATLVGFAVLLTVIAIPTALLIMRVEAPHHADLAPGEAANKAAAHRDLPPLPLLEALRTQPFWLVCLGLFSCGFSMNLLGTHGVPMLMDHGFDAHTSALGIGTIGAVAIVGTLFLGRIADRLPRRNILATIYGVRGLGFFALVVVGTHWELYAAASIGGLVWAGSLAMSSAILADVYGVRLVGQLYGMAFIAHQVGGMISSWLGGWAYERFGTHWVAFGAAGTLLVAAAVLSMQLPARPVRLHAPA